MSAVRFNDLSMLHLLWAAPALIALYGYGFRQRARALRVFADAGLLKHINVSASRSRQWLKAVLVAVAAAFLVVALTRPAWNPKPKTVHRTGRDLVFLLDVSKSMLATDLAPNRLERAKIAIRDVVEKLGGDRVALVAFAGTAAVKCPLTLDYGFFLGALDDISVHSIARGGTQIGDAVRKAVSEVFDDREKRFKDMILITDGEDHDSFPVDAAKEAGERGVRLIAVGLGDEDQGRRIPMRNDGGATGFLLYQGQEVWSKLDADSLRKMVNVTPGGAYFNVATGTIDLGEVYEKVMADAEKRELESRTIERYEEKFQIFIAIAMVLLCAEALVSERRKGA